MSIPEASDPIGLFRQWFDAAAEADIPLPGAVALATVSAEGVPSARMVLLKQFDEAGFVFYTNLESRKAAELRSVSRAALCFYWMPLRRQVRIEGAVELVSDAEADAYFASRPRESRLAAWASRQSAPLENRAVLEERFAQVQAEYDGKDVPRPPFWSGYRVLPERIEFWQELPHRMHDRLLFQRNDEGGWSITRLSP